MLGTVQFPLVNVSNLEVCIEAGDQWFYLFIWIKITIWAFFFCLMVWLGWNGSFVGPMLCPDGAWPETIC